MISLISFRYKCRKGEIEGLQIGWEYLRLDGYTLVLGSLVFDLGGYNGHWLLPGHPTEE